MTSVLMKGIVFGESTRWGRDGRFWFADWGTHEIIAVDAEGHSEVVVRLPFDAFQPLCFDWLPDGRLVIVSSREGRLLVRESDGSLVTYAELNRPGWNEVIVDGRGRAYVNGAAFNPATGQFGPGIITTVDADGSARQVADAIAFPNGMAITPDNATLIIAESHGQRLTAFDLAADGSLSNRRVWADLGDGAPDGICLDAEGAVWYADVPNKCCVRVREGGEVLQRVDFELGAFSCMLGGDDGRTLFTVLREWRGFESTRDSSRNGELRITRVAVPHAGWP